MNNDNLDALFAGLTAPSVSSPSQSEAVQPNTPDYHPKEKDQKAKPRYTRAQQQKAENEHGEQRFCTIINSELVNKMRIIAKREGFNIREVVEAAFMKAVTNYEQKRGKIEDFSPQDVNDLF